MSQISKYFSKLRFRIQAEAKILETIKHNMFYIAVQKIVSLVVKRKLKIWRFWIHYFNSVHLCFSNDTILLTANDSRKCGFTSMKMFETVRMGPFLSLCLLPACCPCHFGHWAHYHGSGHWSFVLFLFYFLLVWSRELYSPDCDPLCQFAIS